MRGLDRVTATRLSFFLSIPALLAAGLYELKDVVGSDIGVGPTVVGTAVSFVVAYAAIAWLLKFVAGHSIAWFVPYRLVLGFVVHRPARDRRDHRDLSRGSQPAGALADDEHHQRAERHQGEGHRVAEQPVQLGHVVEVHAVDAADQRSGAAIRPTAAEIRRMSSFCWIEICAMCASNAVESRQSRLSMVSATRLRWSATSRK